MAIDWFGIDKKNRKMKQKWAKGDAQRKAEYEQSRLAQQASQPQAQPSANPEEDEFNRLEGQTQRLTEAQRARDAEQNKVHQAQSREDVMTEFPGLTPAARQAMQESANKQIMGQLGHYSKILASQQGARGVRGGKAQSDLRRRALDAQNQFQRDLLEKDSDLAMQKLAQYIAGVHGRGANDLLVQQQIRDFLQQTKQKNQQKKDTDYFKGYWNRVGY